MDATSAQPEQLRMTQRTGGTKRSSRLTFRRRLLLVRLLLRGPLAAADLIAAIQRELGDEGYPDAAESALKHDFDALNWTEDRDLIISRVLTAGDWEAEKWLRRQLGDGALRAWIEQRRGRGLDPRRHRFWELILELPHRQVNAWLAEADLEPWSRRTRR